MRVDPRTPTVHAETGARATFNDGSSPLQMEAQRVAGGWTAASKSLQTGAARAPQRSPRDICSCCVKERRHEARPSSAPPAAAAEMSREMSQNSSNVVEVELPSIGTVETARAQSETEWAEGEGERAGGRASVSDGTRRRHTSRRNGARH